MQLTTMLQVSEGPEVESEGDLDVPEEEEDELMAGDDDEDELEARASRTLKCRVSLMRFSYRLGHLLAPTGKRSKS